MNKYEQTERNRNRIAPIDNEEWSHNTFLETYNTTTEFADDAETVSAHIPGSILSEVGHGSYVDGLKKARNGSTDYIDKAEATLQLIDDISPPTESYTRWDTDVFGFVPHIPNAISGVPNAMMRPLSYQRSASAPISIYYNRFSSANYSDEDVTKRGIAVAALAMKLSQYRPVRLVPFFSFTTNNGHEHCFATVDVGVSPFNLPVVLNAMAGVEFYRGLWFVIRQKYNVTMDGCYMGYPVFKMKCSTQERERRTRLVLGASPDDIVMPGLIGSDDGALSDPVQWVTKKLDLYLNREELAA